MIRPWLMLTWLLLLLTACQSGVLPRPSDSMFAQLSGGQFTLHRDMRIPPGRVRVLFQRGIAAYGAGEYEPRCELEVRRILDTPQTIPAGDYRIGKVIGLRRYVDNSAPGANLLAAAGTLRMAYDTSNEWYMYTYRMQLQDERQADPPTLTCGGAYNYAFYARYPTLREMQEALGDYATLTLR